MGRIRPRATIRRCYLDLGVDPGEKYDVAKSHPDVVAALMKSLAGFEAGRTPSEDQLEKRGVKAQPGSFVTGFDKL
jgi:hypothetical protein